MPVIAFHGGPAHGKDVNLPEPLFVYRYIIPMERWEKFSGRKPEIVEYNLIPGVGYFYHDHPQWKAYMQHCHEFTMAAAAEMAREEKANKRLSHQSESSFPTQ